MVTDKANYAVSVGAILARNLQSMAISQKELAEKTGVSKTIINEIIKGKRKISQDVAIRFESVFGAPAEYWLNIQNEYDIAKRKAEMNLITDDIIIKSAKYSAFDVANWFIKRFVKDADKNGEYLTHLKLQKLLYLVQERSLKANNQALFKEPILHWDLGPVVKEVYDEYKSYGANPLVDYADVKVDSETLKLLEGIYKAYETYSASGLVTITHRNSAWLNTEKDEELTLEAIRNSN